MNREKMLITLISSIVVLLLSVQLISWFYKSATTVTVTARNGDLRKR